MVRQAGPGEEPWWSIPGGRVEPGEFVFEAVVREVGEETGIAVLDPGRLAFTVQVDERVLTLRELNRATLARQLLLQRKPLSPAKVIERLVGIQAQSPLAPYLGIWTRVAGFRREALERLLVTRAVVKATVMRQTLHLVTRRDYA